MKKQVAFLVSFIFLIQCAPVIGAPVTNFSKKSHQNSSGVDFSKIKAPLQRPVIGEKITFDVYWFGAHIGTGVTEVLGIEERHGKNAYHFHAVAKSNDFLSKFYPVSDEINTWVDVESFKTLEFQKVLQEGRYRADEKIIYDYKKEKAFYESVKNKSKKEFPIRDNHALDIVASFYWFRTQPIKGDSPIKTRINSDEKDWDLEIAVTALETKELKGKRNYLTMLVEPKTKVKGVLRQRGRAFVNFTVDETRLPVWITLKTPFGPVMGVLKSKEIK